MERIDHNYSFHSSIRLIRGETPLTPAKRSACYVRAALSIMNAVHYLLYPPDHNKKEVPMLSSDGFLAPASYLGADIALVAELVEVKENHVFWLNSDASTSSATENH